MCYYVECRYKTHPKYVHKERAKMEKNIDYKEMYLKMVRASEEALNILIAAQRECEEIYQQQAEDGEAPDSQ